MDRSTAYVVDFYNRMISNRIYPCPTVPEGDVILTRRYPVETLKEFRITLPQEPGQLARVAEALGSREINIMTVAGIVSAEPDVAIVTDNEIETAEVLSELGLVYETIDLLTVSLLHEPGALGSFTRKLGNANINIESIYLLEESAGEVKIALTVNDLAGAEQVLGI